MTNSDELQDLKLEIYDGITRTLELLLESIDERFAKIDERLELFDQQAAVLTTAYLECVAVTEGVVTTLLSSDENKRSEFGEELRKNRKSMMDLLAGYADDVARNDSRFTAAVADMATEELINNSTAPSNDGSTDN